MSDKKDYRDEMNERKEDDLEQESKKDFSAGEESQEETKDESSKENEASEKSDASESADELFDEIESLKNSMLRLQADFNNYRNRSEKEKSSLIRNANEGLIIELLPAIDNFNRAFKAADDAGIEPEMIEGFKLIEKDLITTLKSQGLEEIDSDGQMFDPNYHEAVLAEESDKDSGTVLETLKKGYKLNDKVIRASVVKVSK